MRDLLRALAVALLFASVAYGTSQAELYDGPTRTPALEVLIFEHPDCTYCQAFRRQVLPRYREEVGSSGAPLRFVDIVTNDASALALNGRIEVVPTAVVMREGREVDRIVGYWGPTNFFRLLAHILGRMQ
jgi:thioredoxin-related protein